MATGLGERAARASRSVRTTGWISTQRGHWPSVYVSGLVLLVLLCPCFLLLQYNNSLFVEDGTEYACSPMPQSSIGESNADPGRALVEELKAATRLASGKINGSVPELSSKDLELWSSRYPCQSRGPGGLASFYGRREHTENLPANPLWDEVFHEYSKLHRECMKKVGDVGDYFSQRNTSSGCKFVIADVAGKTGFGNKVLVLASSLLYAIVTKRVILIPSSTFVTSYMCEPFAGSSWLLDDGSTVSLPPTSFKKDWKLDKEIFNSIDRLRRNCDSPSVPEVYAAGVRTNQWQPRQRFYCNLEQSAYSQATFVYLSGCVYTIPKLFTIPLFRPALEALFPDRIVATRLLRSAFLPASSVWRRVQAIDQGYLQPAGRRIGIQLRYNGRALANYEKMNHIMNERVLACLLQNELLPNVSESWTTVAQTKPATISIVQVFIASLFPGLKDHLAQMYGRRPTVTGEGVGVVQVSQNGHQEFSADEDIEAFAEALLLSFSDHLLVTPVSTLGSIAHAYGGLVPWFLQTKKMTTKKEARSCERGQTIEACNQFSEKKYSCSSDASVNGKLFKDVVPYIDNCLTIDHDQGIQLVTKPPGLQEIQTSY